MATVHTVTLKKWGNSIGLLLPAAIAKSVHLTSGVKVEIHVADETLVIRKTQGQSRLDAMCAAITPTHLHDETDWGEPQGSEVW